MSYDRFEKLEPINIDYKQYKFTYDDINKVAKELDKQSLEKYYTSFKGSTERDFIIILELYKRCYTFNEYAKFGYRLLDYLSSTIDENNYDECLLGLIKNVRKNYVIQLNNVNYEEDKLDLWRIQVRWLYNEVIKFWNQCDKDDFFYDEIEEDIQRLCRFYNVAYSDGKFSKNAS